MKRTRGRPAGRPKGKLHRTLIAGSSAMVLGGVGLAVGTAVPAEADHGATANSGILYTDNWRVCPLGYDPATVPSQAADWAIGLWNSNPDITVTRNCSGSHVIISNASFPDTFFGNTWCEGGLDAARNCQLKRLEMNTRTLDAAPNPGAQWKKTACHEMGHVGGLGHRFTDSSCMTQGASPPIVIVPDQHDHDAIAATYPR
jgi:hypothetical protein